MLLAWCSTFTAPVAGLKGTRKRGGVGVPLPASARSAHFTADPVVVLRLRQVRQDRPLAESRLDRKPVRSRVAVAVPIHVASQHEQHEPGCGTLGSVLGRDLPYPFVALALSHRSRPSIVTDQVDEGLARVQPLLALDEGEKLQPTKNELAQSRPPDDVGERGWVAPICTLIYV